MKQRKPASKKLKVIKRYQNRKLYDTERSCYVTLNEIAELIKNGEDLKVIDNKSKRDLTSLTLAQIIFEEEKKRKRLLPLGLLKNIIQTGGGQLVDFWKRSVNTGVSSIGQAQDELESFFEKLFSRGLISREEGQKLFSTFLGFSTRNIEDFQKKVDDTVREALNRLSPGRSLREEFKDLQRKIDVLERKLSNFEKSSD